MRVREVLAECHRRGIALQANGDRLLVDAPKGVLTAELKAVLQEHKFELLALLRPMGDGQPPPLDRPPEDREELGRLVGYLANPAAFAAWLDRLMNTSDPSEGGLHQ